jgi:hypothetical protein
MKKNLTGAQTTSIVIWAPCCSLCPFVLLCVSPVWQSPHPIVPILVGWALGRLRHPVIVIDRFN